MIDDNLSAKDIERLFPAWIIDDLTDNRDRESYHLNALECFDFWRAACAMYDALLPARAQMEGSKGELDEKVEEIAAKIDVNLMKHIEQLQSELAELKARMKLTNNEQKEVAWARSTESKLQRHEVQSFLAIIDRLTAKPDKGSWG